MPLRLPKAGEVLSACAFALAIGFILFAHGTLITYGTGNLLGPGSLNVAFDSLAKNLLRGEATVDPEAIRWELYAVNGKPCMYFAPFPALLRLPLAVLAPALYGLTARFSFLAADLVALAGFAFLMTSALRNNPGLGTASRNTVFYSSLLGFGLGTPLFFLTACVNIYHESMIWALAGSVWASALLLLLVRERPPGTAALAGFSVAAGACLLSKITFAGFAAAVPLISWRLVSEHRSASAPRPGRLALRLLALWVPVTAAAALYIWYNVERFGSPFTFIDYRYYIHGNGNARLMNLLRTAGDFNAARIPTALFNYFGPATLGVLARPPFVSMVPAVNLTDALYPVDYRERVLSLTLASCWLVLPGLCGWLAIFREKNNLLKKSAALTFVPQWAAILSFYFITHRYSAEFLPLLFFGYGHLLAAAPRHPPPESTPARHRPIVLATVLAVLCFISVALTVPSTVYHAAAGFQEVPFEWKYKLHTLFFKLRGQGGLQEGQDLRSGGRFRT